MMRPVHVAGIAVRGPGLAGWAAARPILAGEAPYMPDEIEVPAPLLLSATERRRTGPVTRLALAVAQEAAAQSGLAPDLLRTVFASATGDGQTVHDILLAVTTAGADVSPTQFHNSVHNAAAGYWSIATKSRQAVTCLGCHGATPAAALLTAAAGTLAEEAPTLLCLYDHPMPAALAAKRPVFAPFGVALVLTPVTDAATLATVELEWADAPAMSAAAPVAGLQALQDGNDAARLLPLLGLLAKGEAGIVDLPYLEGRLRVTVSL